MDSRYSSYEAGDNSNYGPSKRLYFTPGDINLAQCPDWLVPSDCEGEFIGWRAETALDIHTGRKYIENYMMIYRTCIIYIDPVSRVAIRASALFKPRYDSGSGLTDRTPIH